MKKIEMRVNNPAHVGKRHTNHKRVTVKTSYIEAVAGIWLDEQPEVVKQTLTKHVCRKETPVTNR